MEHKEGKEARKKGNVVVVSGHVVTDKMEKTFICT